MAGSLKAVWKLKVLDRPSPSARAIRAGQFARRIPLLDKEHLVTRHSVLRELRDAAVQDLRQVNCWQRTEIRRRGHRRPVVVTSLNSPASGTKTGYGPAVCGRS